MDFNIMDYSREELLEMLPPSMHYMVKNDSLMAYGAVESSKAVGLCLFSDSEGQTGQIDLNYIYVTPDSRRKKVATNIVKNASVLFKKHNIRCINTAAMGSPETLMPVYRFMIKNRFLPLAADAKVMSYYVKDLADSKFVQVLMLGKGVLPKAAHFKSYDDPRLKVFLRTYGKENGFYISREEYDSGLCGFYMFGDRIVAAVKVTKQSESNAIVQGPVIPDALKDPRIYPALLADAIRTAKKSMAEDVIISVLVFERYLYDALIKVLGIPEKEELFQKYIRLV